MRVVIADIETPLIPPEGWQGLKEIYCIVTKDVDTGEVQHWDCITGFDTFKEYAATVDKWVFHNGLGFDVWVINNLLGNLIDPQDVIDTFVVSRLVNYVGYSTHSLDEIGSSLGYPKTPFSDFSKYTSTMLQYCKDDVEVGLAIYRHYKKFIDSEDWAKSMRVEHDMAIINNDMSVIGFPFNVERAKEILTEIQGRIDILVAEFQEIWPPSLVPVNEVQYRVKANGELFATTEHAMQSYPKVQLEEDTLVCYDYKSFNPGSAKDRIEKLWEAGWNPVDKTKTHLKFERKARVGEPWGKKILNEEMYEEKKEYFNYYGWTVAEENLLTLPDSAPEGAKKLAEWLTLEGRRSSLVEWLGCAERDGRIHGKFWHIGAWTGRMSHSNPNQANIFSPFHGDPANAVEQIKSEYDADLRALWQADEGSYLVGTDADGIQLRVLAHYMEDEEYAHAIDQGKKEDLTDIHNVNKRALGELCRSRDVAKTFIYAWLLGAGNGKVGQILGCSPSQAKQSVANFLESLPKLKRLKEVKIPLDARRGYFDGLDGRKVIQPEAYLMLAGYLQNGESVIMKHANRLWRQEADKEKIIYKQVDFVHDEWQTICPGSLDMAERLGEIQRNSLHQVGESLGLLCPIRGSTDIGRNWLETH